MTAPSRELPCNLPCSKCGSVDIYRRFYAKGNYMKSDTYGKAPSRYAGGLGTYHWTATRDHLQHYCRCCGYTWETLPLRKTKP